MIALPPLRLLPALAGALLITLLVFLFMQGLIEQGRRDEVVLPVFEQVQVLRERAPEERTETEPVDMPEAPEKPQMESLAAGPPAPTPAPAPGQSMDLPALDLSMGDLAVPSVGENWSVPLGRGGIGLPSGQDARGYVEVVPYNTRRPNVPEEAWRNRISGWVLVAFTVTPQGYTRDVRVLDASPRGLFEDKVMAAVQDWRYNLSFSGKSAGNVVLTQRVDVDWRNYPQNLPNVD